MNEVYGEVRIVVGKFVSAERGQIICNDQCSTKLRFFFYINHKVH